MEEELRVLEQLAYIIECAAIGSMGEARTELARLNNSVCTDFLQGSVRREMVKSELGKALDHYTKFQYQEGSSILSQVSRRLWKEVMS